MQSYTVFIYFAALKPFSCSVYIGRHLNDLPALDAVSSRKDLRSAFTSISTMAVLIFGLSEGKLLAKEYISITLGCPLTFRTSINSLFIFTDFSIATTSFFICSKEPLEILSQYDFKEFLH